MVGRKDTIYDILRLMEDWYGMRCSQWLSEILRPAVVRIYRVAGEKGAKLRKPPTHPNIENT